MYNKNFSKEPTEKQKIGQIGEDETCKYLVGLGYKIVERNYLKKWGEIDVICKKDNKLHFVEVKSVTHVTPVVEQSSQQGRLNDSYMAEDNMHPWKLKRLSRAVQSYLLDRDVPDSIDWQFDLAVVQINKNNGLVKVELLEDIVL